MNATHFRSLTDEAPPDRNITNKQSGNKPHAPSLLNTRSPDIHG